MSDKLIVGVFRITGHINKVVIPEASYPISEDTVRRRLKAYECGSGGLVCEERQNKKRAGAADNFKTNQSSLDALSDPCNIDGFEDMADYCGMSVRWVKDKCKNDSKFPTYKLFGRYYSTQNSLTNYMRNHWQKPEKWKPTKRQASKLGITWTDL